MVRVTAPPKTKRSKRRSVILGLDADGFLSVFRFEVLLFFALFLVGLASALELGSSTGTGTPGGTGVTAAGAIEAGG